MEGREGKRGRVWGEWKGWRMKGMGSERVGNKRGGGNKPGGRNGRGMEYEIIGWSERWGRWGRWGWWASMTARPPVPNVIFGNQSVKRALTGPDGLLTTLNVARK